MVMDTSRRPRYWRTIDQVVAGSHSNGGQAVADQQWFYASGNDTTAQGPVSIQALQQLIAGGHVANDARVWTEGMGAWETAATRPEFNAISASSVSERDVGVGVDIGDVELSSAQRVCTSVCRVLASVLRGTD